MIADFSRVRAVLAGGGWLNRTDEALPFVEHALDMAGGPWQVLTIPTPDDPGDDPQRELAPLESRLSRIAGLQVSHLGHGGSWPTRDELSEGLAWANVVLIPGGNFTEYLVRATPYADLLLQKFLSGEAVFAGSSTGTASWFTHGFTADLPHAEGGGIQLGYRPISALGALPGYVCVHYNERHNVSGIPRGHRFQEYLATRPPGTVGLGIDTPAAAILDRGHLRAVSIHPYSHIQHITVGRSINPLRGDRLRVRAIHQGDPAIPFTDLYPADTLLPA